MIYKTIAFRRVFLPVVLLLLASISQRQATAQQPVLIKGQAKLVQSLLFSADGKSLYVGYDFSREASLAKFDLASPDQPPAVLAKGIIGIDHLFLDSAGQRLLAGDVSGNMQEWDLTKDTTTSDKQWKFSEEKVLVKAMAISPDGKQLIGGLEQDLKLVDRDTREVIKTFTGHTKKVEAVAFSSDGKYIASAADSEKLRVWETGGKQLGEFRVANAVLGYSPKENLVVYQGVVSEADFDIHLVEVPSMKERGALKVGYYQMKCVAFSPDGSMLATGLDGGSVIVWNATTGAKVAQLDNVAKTVDLDVNYISSVAFSPDSKTLAVGSYNGNIKLFAMGAAKPAVKPGAMVATKPGDTSGDAPTAGGLLDLSDQNVRIWRSSDGKFSIKAKLVAYEDETASLETPDGRVIKVPASKLGFRERKYLKELK